FWSVLARWLTQKAVPRGAPTTVHQYIVAAAAPIRSCRVLLKVLRGRFAYERRHVRWRVGRTESIFIWSRAKK
ncbi:hypothetical protein SMMN14_06084, partial [Sphaerulina musiva]